MRRLAPLLGLLLVGCRPALTNAEVVYPPIAGIAEVRWQADVSRTAMVTYWLSGTPLGASRAASDRFMLQFDSTRFPNGLHVLKLRADDAEGEEISTLEHTLVIEN